MTGQKKLIVDDSIVPAYPVFDYKVTYSTPPDLTADVALDGVSHSLEVLYGAIGKPNYNDLEEVASICIRLAVKYMPLTIADPKDEEAREALCLATDLGGYSIMTVGTDGGHRKRKCYICVARRTELEHFFRWVRLVIYI